VAALLAVEPATMSVLATWLSEHGWAAADAQDLAATPDLLIAQMRFPRTEAPQVLQASAERFPGVPVIVVSPTIVAGTPSRSEAARQLGVAAVLAMPLSRAALITTVEDLMGPA
jgi:DNA-binding NtrC family response regulator